MAVELGGKNQDRVLAALEPKRSVSRRESARVSAAESVHELLHQQRPVKTILGEFRKN